MFKESAFEPSALELELIESAELLEEARGWILDTFPEFAEDPEETLSIAPVAAARIISRHYDGGAAGFLQNNRTP